MFTEDSPKSVPPVPSPIFPVSSKRCSFRQPDEVPSSLDHSFSCPPFPYKRLNRFRIFVPSYNPRSGGAQEVDRVAGWLIETQRDCTREVRRFLS